MKKASSTSNLYETPKNILKCPSSTTRPKIGVSNSSLFTQRIHRSSNKYSRHLKLNRSIQSSSTSFMSVISSLTKEVLYEETLSLKHEVNKLINQISLIKSDIRKKEVDLSLREKMIEGANVNALDTQDRFDLLIDSNNISKIKKAFNQLKVAYNNMKDNNSIAKQTIRYSKPNEIKNKIEHIEASLCSLISQYIAVHNDNYQLENELNEALRLSIAFSNQHQYLSFHQLELDEAKGRVETLQIKLNVKKDAISKNENLKKKLMIERTSLMKQKQKLINEKQSNDAFCKEKPMLISKIKELEEKVKYYKEEIGNNDKLMKSIQSDIEKIENAKGKDKTQLEPIDYHRFELIESDPLYSADSKVLLMKSLINESNNAQRKYLLKIKASMQLLQEFGKPECSINEITAEMDQIAQAQKENALQQESIPQQKPPEADKSKEQDNKHSIALNNPISEFNSKAIDNLSITPLPNNNDTKDTSLHQIDQQLPNEQFTEITYVIIKNIEAKRYTPKTAEEKISKKLTEPNPRISKDSFINQIALNIQEAIDCHHNEDDIKKIKQWLESLFLIYHNDISKVTESFSTLFSNIRTYTDEEDLILSKKIKKVLLPYKDKLKEMFPSSSTGNNIIVSYLLLKNFIEDKKVDMKDSYGEFLFYKLKQFKPSAQVSLYDLDLKLLYDIFDNSLNDSKMNVKTENDIEISQEDYVRIISQFAMALKNHLIANSTTLKLLLSASIQTIESGTSEPGFDVINIEVFVEEMRKIKIEISSELEIYCLFNRYKISDDYEYLSVDLIENDLWSKTKYEGTTKQVMENVPEEEDESNENKVE